jgi:hypothetical protein
MSGSCWLAGSRETARAEEATDNAVCRVDYAITAVISPTQAGGGRPSICSLLLPTPLALDTPPVLLALGQCLGVAFVCAGVAACRTMEGSAAHRRLIRHPTRADGGLDTARASRTNAPVCRGLLAWKQLAIAQVASKPPRDPPLLALRVGRGRSSSIACSLAVQPVHRAAAAAAAVWRIDTAPLRRRRPQRCAHGSLVRWRQLREPLQLRHAAHRTSTLCCAQRCTNRCRGGGWRHVHQRRKHRRDTAEAEPRGGSVRTQPLPRHRRPSS